jgi:hypothetical protein
VDLDLDVDLNDEQPSMQSAPITHMGEQNEHAGHRPGPRRRPGPPAKRDLHPFQSPHGYSYAMCSHLSDRASGAHL